MKPPFFADLTAKLCEAVSVRIRYDMPDNDGETRRERNERFGEPSPDVIVPPEAAHVWGWFWMLSNRRCSGPEALSFLEIDKWQKLTGTKARKEEIAMLTAMDDAYLSAVHKEQESQLARMQSRQGKGGK